MNYLTILIRTGNMQAQIRHAQLAASQVLQFIVFGEISDTSSSHGGLTASEFPRYLSCRCCTGPCSSVEYGER